MNAKTDALWIRLRDLARKQKAAVEAGNLDEADLLAGRRRELLLDIQKNDAIAGGGKPSAPDLVIREILAIDEEAMKALKVGMQAVSDELENINTLKVLFHGAVDDARSRSGASAS